MTGGQGTPVYTIVPVETMANRRAVVVSMKLGDWSVRQSDICQMVILYNSQMCKG